MRAGGAVERAFTWERVGRLTGLSKRQLQYWDEQRFLRPTLSAGRGRGHPRLYAFRDLVALRVAADLRRQGISLQLIRKVDRYLRKLDYDHPLSELTFRVLGAELYFEESKTWREGRKPEQTVATYEVPLAAIVEHLEADIAELTRRSVGRFERRRGALGSKELFAGTRIPVDSVRRMVAAGISDADIIAGYPDLEAGDIAAVRREKPRRPVAV
ncbi:MAG: DUF433 domain-containing protein [Candidatus Dormibacteraeota bacterium]|nr:DUF433 domain-containing protein [Candidatus Dormibacteraeota bacterium]